MVQKQKGNIAVIAVIIVIVAITVAVFTWNFAKKSQTVPLSATPTVQQQPAQSSTVEKTEAVFDKKGLEAAAFDAINTKTKGVWDKKLETKSIHASQKAAMGIWWAKDAWNWIAWQQDDGKWKILVDMDGFSCKELESVPSQYNAHFFENVTYQMGKIRCY